MGLFDGFKKKDAKQVLPDNTEGLALLEKHEKGEMNDVDFLKAFRDQIVYYTTPFGDHKDGTQKLFAIPKSANEGYIPVFLSETTMREYYDNVGRVGLMILQAPFIDVVQTTMKMNSGKAPVKLGVLIDPKEYKVTLDAPMLETIERMMLGH